MLGNNDLDSEMEGDLEELGLVFILDTKFVLVLYSSVAVDFLGVIGHSVFFGKDCSVLEHEGDLERRRG